MRYFVLLFCVFLGIWFSGCCDCPTQPKSREFVVWGKMMYCDLPWEDPVPCDSCAVDLEILFPGNIYEWVCFGKTFADVNGKYSFMFGEDYLDKNISWRVLFWGEGCTGKIEQGTVECSCFYDCIGPN